MRKKLLFVLLTVIAGFYTTGSFGQCMTSFTVTNIKDISCNGGGDGEISVAVTGGKAPFTYEIFVIDGGGEIPLGSIPGSMSQTVTFGAAYGNLDDPITGLPAYSNYRVRVTSSETNLAFGCKVRTISGIDITEPSLIELSAETEPDCGSNTGSINLVVTGGSPNFSYSWTGPSAIGNIANPTGLAAGIYSVTIMDNNSCSETLSNIVVEAGPDVNITPVAPVCITNSAFNLSAATAGGSWSGTGITNASLGTFDPATAGSGSWIVTYTLTANGCTKSDTETIEVKATPDATINAAGPFCLGSPAVNLSAATAGGIWSGPGITNSTEGTFNSASAGVGTHTITYEISDNGCSSTATVNIVVNPAPDATISAAGPFCSNGISANLTAATAGGTWSGPGITNTSEGTFDPATAGAGSHLITYEVTTNGCTSTDTETIIVNQAPNATITPVSALCVNSAAFNLLAATLGGSWSGTGITDATAGTFNPATAGVGSHIITYEVTINGCTSTDTETIEVAPLPDATITPAGPFCSNANAINLSAATSGGTWSGAGITNGSAGTFNPSTAGVGSHIITYEVTVNGCTSTDTETIIVNDVPDATISPVSALCVNAIAFNLSAATSGGSWSGAGITNATAGTFNPATAGVGSHVITYELTVNGCTSSDTETIEVAPLPDATITPAGPFCSNGNALNLSAATSGGSWSGPGITDATAGTFNPVTAGTGSHVITYEVTVNGCTSTDTETIEVSPLPDATIVPAGPFCSNANTINLSAATPGGSWSGTGIINSSTGTFNPATAGPGSHVITYEVNINGCTSTDTETIVVENAQDASITSVDPVCLDASVFNLSATISGGTWSGVGITNASSGTFNPAIAGPGSHEINYEVLVNGCTISDTEIIEVIQNPDATINQAGPVCISSAAFNLAAATTGGNWSGFGITDASTGTFDPAVAGPGTHEIFYEISVNGCTSSDIMVIEVTPLPDATIGTVAALCINDEAFNLTAATGGGTWSGTGIVNSTTGAFDPSIAGAGSWTITYTIILNGCHTYDTELIHVTPSPEAPDAEVPNQFCINTAVDNLSASGNDLKWYSDENLLNFVGSGENLDPSPFIDNTVAGSFNFFVTQTISGCESPATTVTLHIIDSTPDSPAVSDVSVCINTEAELTADGSNLEWYADELLSDLLGTGPTFQPDPQIFDNTVTGSFTFYVTQSLPGCGKSAGAAIVLNYIDDSPEEAPVASLEGGETCDSFVVAWTAVPGTGYRYDLSIQNDFSTFLANNDAINGTETRNTFHNLSPGVTYYFRVRSENSCGIGPASNVISITLPSLSTVPVVSSPGPICINEDIPVINVPGNNIKWYSNEELSDLVYNGNSFQPVGLIDNSEAGSNVFYVTQTSGTCSESEAVEITITFVDDASCPQDCESSNLAISLSTINHATCFAPTSGSATVAASGGVAPYNFSWFNSNNDLINTTSSISNLPEGYYQAIVTDKQGCTSTLSIFIYESFLLTTTINPQTNCEPDGAISLLIEGGSGDFIYQWSNTAGYQSTSENISNLEAGTYDLTVLDLNTFCSKELSGVIVENNIVGSCNPDECESPSVVAHITDLENPGCAGEGTGSVTIQASGSTTGNYFYSIDNGATWNLFEPGYLVDGLASGQHSLLIGDKELDLCPENIEFTIAEPSVGLQAKVKNSTISFPDQPTGSIAIDQISGGTSPYKSKISLKVPSFPDQQLELDWNTVSLNSNTMEYELNYTNLYSGKYEVTIQDDNGCEIILEIDLDFDRSILIPNVFTPNGDGYNDTFYIRNLPEVGTQLVVANKWGKTVFESKDYRNNWTGGELPEGIYFYTMVTTSGNKYNGWVEIWRGPAF